ncbi:DNA polymerase zeta [Gonapodya sp. JEL0774]|nr:DNA polymerase zeta [Gonapodya sp. JEL0774]
MSAAPAPALSPGDVQGTRAFPSDAVFSLRIVSMDTYQSPPHPWGHAVSRPYAFARDGAKHVGIRSVPTIRVFGITRWGQKATMHVHQCWPYFYIPYEGSTEHHAGSGMSHLRDQSTADITQFLVSLFARHLAVSLNHALAIARNTDPNNPSRSQHVHSIILCKGIPFYGLHTSYTLFLKVSFIDSFSCSRAADLLSSGAVLGRPFQPHEAHIPYLLQFLLDHNLFGMDFIHLRNVRFRTPINVAPRDQLAALQSSLPPNALLHTETTVPANLIWPPSSKPPPRTSYSDLELDCWCADILNRISVSERPHEPLLRIPRSPQSTAHPTPSSSIQNLSVKQPYVPSLSAIWSDEVARRLRSGLPTDLSPQISQEPPRTTPEDWDIEPELRQSIEERCTAAAVNRIAGGQLDGDGPAGSRGVQQGDPYPGVPTAWRSTELAWSMPGALTVPIVNDNTGVAANDLGRVHREGTWLDGQLGGASNHFAEGQRRIPDVEPIINEKVLSQHLSQGAAASSQGMGRNLRGRDERWGCGLEGESEDQDAFDRETLEEGNPGSRKVDSDDDTAAILDWMRKNSGTSGATISQEESDNRAGEGNEEETPAQETMYMESYTDEDGEDVGVEDVSDWFGDAIDGVGNADRDAEASSDSNSEDDADLQRSRIGTPDINFHQPRSVQPRSGTEESVGALWPPVIPQYDGAGDDDENENDGMNDIDEGDQWEASWDLADVPVEGQEVVGESKGKRKAFGMTWMTQENEERRPSKVNIRFTDHAIHLLMVDCHLQRRTTERNLHSFPPNLFSEHSSTVGLPRQRSLLRWKIPRPKSSTVVPPSNSLPRVSVAAVDHAHSVDVVEDDDDESSAPAANRPRVSQEQERRENYSASVNGLPEDEIEMGSSDDDEVLPSSLPKRKDRVQTRQTGVGIPDVDLIHNEVPRASTSMAMPLSLVPVSSLAWRQRSIGVGVGGPEILPSLGELHNAQPNLETRGTSQSNSVSQQMSVVESTSFVASSSTLPQLSPIAIESATLALPESTPSCDLQLPTPIHSTDGKASNFLSQGLWSPPRADRMDDEFLSDKPAFLWDPPRPWSPLRTSENKFDGGEGMGLAEVGTAGDGLELGEAWRLRESIREPSPELEGDIIVHQRTITAAVFRAPERDASLPERQRDREEVERLDKSQTEKSVRSTSAHPLSVGTGHLFPSESRTRGTWWKYSVDPPSVGYIARSCSELNVPETEYKGILQIYNCHFKSVIGAFLISVVPDAHYSNPADVPLRPKIFAGKEWRLKSLALSELPEWDFSIPLLISNHVPGLRNDTESSFKPSWMTVTANGRRKWWTPHFPPPNRGEIGVWLRKNPQGQHVEGISEEDLADVEIETLQIETKADESSARGILATQVPMRDIKAVSQIEAPTPKNPYGFKFEAEKSHSSVTHERQYYSMLSLDVLAGCAKDMLPDPAKDSVRGVFFCLYIDGLSLHKSNGIKKGFHVGIIKVDDGIEVKRTGITGYPTEIVSDERSLFEALVAKVREFDPDIILGYEIHNSSWGYLVERSHAIAYNLLEELSRTKAHATTKHSRDEDEWGFNQTTSVHVTGRVVLNVWRLMRGELNLTSYTFENLVYHVLHQRVVRKIGFVAMALLDRGSQFKVESVMARIAKPQNLIMFSPSKNQVASQRAAECLPLIMEPESQFYNSPLLVLDFQSLYPSVMIAYNYCSLTTFSQPGAGKMLSEILDTRVMVKSSMKLHTDDKALMRLLDARQLSLKYLANVTYGYTSASFSGRMPCIDIADAIVQTGRETLEKAIKLIHSTPEWGARVVYGDTDSLFVYLPGASKERAWKVGKEIVDEVTNRNPYPMKLKLEKTKKKYVGWMYETEDQKDATFDAKGIETVRRDGCPAVTKILEQCLKILFRTQDISMVKTFVVRQFSKIITGKVSIQDFIIAKEVRLGTYSDKGIPPPGVIVAKKKMEFDKRAEPQYGERVPFVVVNGGPDSRLYENVVSPEELLKSRSLRLNAHYYITKQIIPALARTFSLMGVGK